ncbi:hypothetical protein GUJ93_ZPchr0002g23933 [Zizania palustris]|uniref:DYW domain-containing protein n=1 Tax=Zizania palustris TaxID=103762 RepID=A0A8J5VR33_ZIZPA|nr:hypothetical protein GUJ93_ZPchr0002g23933 [Zizania palustris]
MRFDARKVFDGGHEGDPVSWNCLLRGEFEEAIAVLWEMLEIVEYVPERVTLCGCIEGEVYVFDNLGANMSVDTWNVMLAGFTANGCSERALELFRARMESTWCVLLSNIYALDGNWKEVHKVRKLMVDRGVQKVPESSSIETDGVIHEFISGDKSHSRKEDIYKMLSEMCQQFKTAGYVPDTSQVLLDIDDDDVKESSLALYSEKLAIGFGLIGTTTGMPIRIVKNLRVCGDCHNAIKLLGKIYGRCIIVMDAN